MSPPIDPSSSFVDVYVEPCAASEDGVSLRFKRAEGSEVCEVRALAYESEDGLDGRWIAAALASDDDEAGAPAAAVQVEDSSDGTVWLVVGGAAGLRLTHEATGTIVHEPYLVLSLSRAARFG